MKNRLHDYLSHLQESEPQRKSFQQLVGGKEVLTTHGGLLVVEKKLSDFELASELERKTREYRAGFTLEKLKREFPQFRDVRKGRVMFFDIETCGLGYRHPLISIAFSKMFSHSSDLDLCALVARNYAEEKAILSYFFEQMKGFDVLFSYNGASFDFPRLKQRAKVHKLVCENYGQEVLTPVDEMEPIHFDLYQRVKRVLKSKLENSQIKTFEQIAFKFDRKEVVPASAIPETYHEFVYGADVRGNHFSDFVYERRVRDMAMVIEHNLLDTIVLPAILGYLFSLKDNNNSK